MKLLLNLNLYLKCFHGTCCLRGRNESKVSKQKFRAFLKPKTYGIYAEFEMGSKFHCKQWKTNFSRFIDKFLQF